MSPVEKVPVAVDGVLGLLALALKLQATFTLRAVPFYLAMS